MSTDVQVEKLISLPVINPATKRRSRSFRLGGKVDRTERTVLFAEVVKQIDWKGCSKPAEAIAAMSMSLQAELYALANPHVTEIEFRFMQRPTLKFDSKQCHSDPVIYEEACYQNMKLDGRMVTHSVMLSDGAKSAARQHAWDCGQRVLNCRKTDSWLQSGTACYQWHKPCEFLPVCEASKLGGDWEDVANDLFVKSDPHPELDGGLAKDFGVLTYSSMSTLTLCEMKYYFLYELGLRKRNADYDEPLRVGSALHAGLEGIAKGGLSAANDAIDEWSKANPIMGGNSGMNTQRDIAKARGMVRAASEKWCLDAE